MYSVFFIVTINDEGLYEIETAKLPFGLNPHAENTLRKNSYKTLAPHIGPKDTKSYATLEDILRDLLKRVSFQTSAFYQVVGHNRPTRVARVISLHSA
jgi:hypothetical protein